MLPNRHYCCSVLKQVWFLVNQATRLNLVGCAAQTDRGWCGCTLPPMLAGLALIPWLAQPAPLLAQPLIAQARDGYLGTDQGFDIYVDSSSVVTTLPIVRFRLRAVATPAAGQPRSTQFEMSLDCSARILRVLRATRFDGSGQVLASQSYPLEDPARSLASFGEIGNRIHATVCAGQGGNLYRGS